VRKRRCTPDYIEKCENCLREGLECRKPDIDGRKTRWKRGRADSDSNVNFSASLEGASSRPEAGEAGQGDFRRQHSEDLFNTLMGEHGMQVLS
jgi:hypothetical protein